MKESKQASIQRTARQRPRHVDDEMEEGRFLLMSEHFQATTAWKLLL
jgi:hypothetical protein